MIDIHSHILPSVDDGARNIAESISILESAAGQGVIGIVATPHVLASPTAVEWQQVVESFQRLSRECCHRKLPLSLYLGAECRLSPELPEMVRANPALSINGGMRYLLLEFPFYEIPLFANQTIYELQLMGITPIIAHPERCQPIVNDLTILHEFIVKGLLVQIDAGSVLGRFGRKTAKTAHKMLRLGWVHMVASDTHSPQVAPYDLAAARRVIGKSSGRDALENMFVRTPDRVVKGTSFVPPPLHEARPASLSWPGFFNLFTRRDGN